MRTSNRVSKRRKYRKKYFEINKILHFNYLINDTGTETEAYPWVVMVPLFFSSSQPNQWILRFYRTWAPGENCPGPRCWDPSTKPRSSSCCLLSIPGVQEVSKMPWLPSRALRHPRTLSMGELCWAEFPWRHRCLRLGLTGSEKAGWLLAHVTLSAFHS